MTLLPLRAARAASQTMCAIVMENAAGANGALADLVQVKVTTIPQTRWVERVDVDRVLAEQQIAAVLGAENVRERVQIGQLLKADVLVLLRPRETPTAKLLDVTIAEANQGLRLLSTTVPQAAQAEGTADAVVRQVKRAVAKFRETVVEVCAVPPMVSKDLGYEFEHLKTGFSDVIEQMLASQRGVLVVELAEANALAKELARTNSGPVKRALPLYVLGEYRNDGDGAARRLTISLKLNRGESPVASVDLKSLSLSEAPARVRETTAALMKQAGRAIVTPVDAEREITAMRERIAEYERVGQWTEAFDLVDAALLLNPEQPDLRYKALEYIGHIDWQGLLRDRYKNDQMLASYGRRALAHFDVLQNGMSDAQRLEAFAQLKRRLPGLAVSFNGEPPRGQLAVLEVEVARYATGMIQGRLARSEDIRSLVEIVEGMYCGKAVLAAFIEETRGPALDALRRGAFTPARNGSLMQHHKQLIDILSKSSHADVRDAAAAGLTELKAIAARPADQDTYKWRPVPEPAGEQLHLRRLSVNQLDIDGKPRRFPIDVHDWLPAGKGIDVTWDYRTINLMKRPGELTCVFAEKENFPGRGMVDVRIADVKFDGHYLWVTTKRGDPLVVVIEPASGRVYRMGAAHGLPPMRTDVARSTHRAGEGGARWSGIADVDRNRDVRAGHRFQV